jgi:hypothetical protein
MKHASEMGLNAMREVPSFKMIGTGIVKSIILGETDGVEIA